MNYSAAFESLGYALANVRQDWSAAGSDGICISIWIRELGRDRKRPYLDLWELHPEGGTFEAKSGHRKRTAHLERAVAEHGGFVDVVLVDGVPGESYGDAQPWDAQKRGGKWFISKFDPANGYFRAEVNAD
ncbi:MAG: hypothetical protein WAT70_13930 [Rhizobiaceae bacterium]